MLAVMWLDLSLSQKWTHQTQVTYSLLRLRLHIHYTFITYSLLIREYLLLIHYLFVTDSVLVRQFRTSEPFHLIPPSLSLPPPSLPSHSLRASLALDT